MTLQRHSSAGDPVGPLLVATIFTLVWAGVVGAVLLGSYVTSGDTTFGWGIILATAPFPLPLLVLAHLLLVSREHYLVSRVIGAIAFMLTLLITVLSWLGALLLLSYTTGPVDYTSTGPVAVRLTLPLPLLGLVPPPISIAASATHVPLQIQGAGGFPVAWDTEEFGQLGGKT